MMIIPFCLLTISDDEERDFITALYLQNYHLMLSIARHYTQEKPLIEDIVSDSLVALHGQVATLRGLSQDMLRVYIITTVRNTTINLIKRNQRLQARNAGEEALHGVPDSANIEHQVVLMDELDHVLKIICTLPDKEQAVVRMKFFDNMSNAEIAKALGLSESSIPQYVVRARNKIRRKIFGKRGSADG